MPCMYACLALSIGATTRAAMPNDEWVMCSHRLAFKVCLHMYSTIIHSATFAPTVANYRWDTHVNVESYIHSYWNR